MTDDPERFSVFLQGFDSLLDNPEDRRRIEEHLAERSVALVDFGSFMDLQVRFNLALLELISNIRLDDKTAVSQSFSELLPIASSMIERNTMFAASSIESAGYPGVAAALARHISSRKDG